MEKRRSAGKQPLALSMSGKSLMCIVNEGQGFLAPEFEYPPCSCGL